MGLLSPPPLRIKVYADKARDPIIFSSLLAPGAQALIKVLTDANMPPSQRLHVNKAARNLTVTDRALVLRAFDNWFLTCEVRVLI